MPNRLCLVTILLAPAIASAEIPDLTFDGPPSPGLPFHNNGPSVATTLSATCSDPSSDYPITMNCQVVDVTAGTTVSDVVCGTGTATTTVTHDFDVDAADLVAGHEYHYRVRCQDNPGNARWTSYLFLWDDQAPVVTIASSPDDPQGPTDADFGITCADDSYTYDWSSVGSYTPSCRLFCRLFNDVTGVPVTSLQTCDVDSVTDAATVASQTYPGLTTGRYRFEVYGRDTPGNQSALAQTIWTVDTDPPDTEILTGPAAVASSLDANFTFQCSDPSCTFECTITDSVGTVISAGPCTSGDTFTVPRVDSYTMVVLASDLLGNRDPDATGTTVSTYDWAIDSAPPETSITTSPPAASNDLDATFEFACDDAPYDTLPCTFTCTLTDSGGSPVASGPCTSGDTFTVPAEGTYTFVVLAADNLGNADTDAGDSTVVWTVDTTAPVAPVIDTPGSGEALTQCPVLSGSAEPGATVTILLDGAEIARVTAAGDGSWSYDTAGGDCPDDGAHTLSVLAQDPAGNPSPTTSVDFDFALDTDADGLTDAIETGGANPTSPTDPDSDDDGLCDGPLAVLGTCAAGEDADADGEVDTGETDPNDADSDDGGVDDGEEITRGTDPLDDWDDTCVTVTDCDGDGLTNDEETTNGTNPKLSDTDGDGLTDFEEITLGTDGTEADTDGDGLGDGVEVNGDNPSDPLDDDSDDDGLLDGEEDLDGDGTLDTGESDPNVADSDGDGLDDGIEVNGDNPTNPDEADTDGDGLADGTEDANGNGALDEGETDPNSPDTDGDGLGDATDPQPLIPVPTQPGGIGVPSGCDCNAPAGGVAWLLLVMVAFAGRRRR